MKSPENLAGHVFGRLTVQSMSAQRDKWNHILWDCQCLCGTIKRFRIADLKAGNVRSCGCLLKERYAALRTQPPVEAHEYHVQYQTIFGDTHKDGPFKVHFQAERHIIGLLRQPFVIHSTVELIDPDQSQEEKTVGRHEAATREEVLRLRSHAQV